MQHFLFYSNFIIGSAGNHGNRAVQKHQPEPSGIERTKVGSIFRAAVEFVSRPSPLTISLRNCCAMSSKVSSENRMEYKYLSIWRIKLRVINMATIHEDVSALLFKNVKK